MEDEAMSRIAIALVALLFVASCGDDGGPSLVGVWTGTEVSGGAAEWTFVLDEEDVSVASSGDEVYEGTYITYPDEDPKRMVFAVTESMFPEYVGESAYAIYRFDSETLIIASNEPGVADAPTGFVPDGLTRVWELTKP
jgi:hypothetical protein